jgi:hypothetical protein
MTAGDMAQGGLEIGRLDSELRVIQVNSRLRATELARSVARSATRIRAAERRVEAAEALRVRSVDGGDHE